MGVVEAEAMGVPVIVTDIPGPRDAIAPGKTGLLIPAKDVEALVGAMEEILTKDAEIFGKQGYELVLEKFEQAQFFSAILKDRKQLLGE